jgi:hypothetical protein
MLASAKEGAALETPYRARATPTEVDVDAEDVTFRCQPGL